MFGLVWFGLVCCGVGVLCGLVWFGVVLVWFGVVVGCWLLVVVCCCLLLFVVVCCCLLLFVSVGCWLLVVGCWLLVVGCWLLVVGCKMLTEREVYVHNLLRLIVQEPSTTKNSSSSRAPKTGAQLRDDPEEREKCPTLHRQRPLAESPLSLCTLEDPQTLAKN